MTGWQALMAAVLGLLAAFVERRDGWRYARLAQEVHQELATLRERVTALEHGQPRPSEHHDPVPSRPWWAFWRPR